MKAEVFFIIKRVKDGLYYMSTDEDGQRMFVSVLDMAKKFQSRQKALDQIKAMQNWLGRPKFELVTGQHIHR